MDSNVTLKSNVVLVQKIRKIGKLEIITVLGDPNYKWYVFWDFKCLFRIGKHLDIRTGSYSA